MNNIQIFKNEKFGEIRTVVNESGEPMFCLADVCKMLELGNPSQTKTRLNPNGTQLIDFDRVIINEGVIINKLGNSKATFINEGNLYKCIFQSRKPDAEKFQDWVTEEVLPSIRKHGAYFTPEKLEEALSDPDTLIKLATTLKEERQKRIAAETKIERQAPKVLFATAVETSQKSCLIGELAKILRQNGVDMGEKRLFFWLRQNGYLCGHGERYNQPTQKAMELGVFEIKKTTITKPSGEVLVSTTTKVTGKGQIYFVNRFLKKEVVQC